MKRLAGAIIALMGIIFFSEREKGNKGDASELGDIGYDTALDEVLQGSTSFGQAAIFGDIFSIVGIPIRNMNPIMMMTDCIFGQT